LVEDDIAIGAVGDGVVAVVSVIPIVQRREVEVYSVDHRIRGIVPFRELEEVTKVNERHCRFHNDVAIIERIKSRRLNGKVRPGEVTGNGALLRGIKAFFYDAGLVG